MSNVVELNPAPNNLEAEQHVLGAILIDPNAYSQASDIITPEHFFKPIHGDVYEAMEYLSRRGDAITPLTITEQMKRLKTWSKTVNTCLITVCERIHSSAGMEEYCKIVHDKFLLRELLNISTEMSNDARSDEHEAADILETVERRLHEISKTGYAGGFDHIGAIIEDVAPTAQALIEKPERAGALPSAIPALDELTAGFHRSDLVIIAGRPGMGKTSLALNIAQHLTTVESVPVGVFSLEMSAEQLLTRMLCAEAHVDGARLRRGHVRNDEVEALGSAIKMISGVPLYVDQTGGLSLKELRAKARLMKARHDVRMIVVDYLQLVFITGRKPQNREQEISLISRSMKALAKELDIPILALSQLSRATDLRPGRRPQLSDLRESGSLEQDADLVLFMYRPEVYDDDDAEVKGYAEIIIGKQRNGPVGVVPVAFQRGVTRFQNLTWKLYDEAPLPVPYDEPQSEHVNAGVLFE